MTQTLSSHKLHKAWLKITAVIVGSFGPIFFLGAMLATSEPARWTLDFLSWPLDGTQNYASPETRFLSAVTGGFLLGWGVMIWCLSVWVYDSAPEAVRKSVLTGLLAWFVLDSAGSIASGTASNAIFNIFLISMEVAILLVLMTEVLPKNLTRAMKRALLRLQSIRQITINISNNLSIVMMKRTVVSGLRWSSLRIYFRSSINFQESSNHDKQHG